MNRNSAELKTEAKGILLGKYGTVIGAMILVELITVAISLLTSSVVSTGSLGGAIIYYMITFIVTLISALFGVGLVYLNLNIICNRTYKVSDVFYGFKAHPDKAIIVQFLITLISFACMIPALVVFVIYCVNKAAILIMFTSLLAVIGGIAAVIFSLWYSQVFYLILDFPEYTSLELMSVSKKIMKGHCGRLFYLQISFIPLYLLGLLSCGIGMLFIAPYASMTRAYFYMDLIQSREQNTAAAPEYGDTKNLL